LEKNKKDSPPKKPLEPGGCSVFRQGLVVSALRKRLAQGLDPEEERQVRAEIEDLEARLGL